MVFPTVAPPDPRGPWFVQTWIYFIPESFHVNMSFTGSMVLKKIFTWPHPIFAIIPPLKRTWPLIWTMQNSPYLRMICTKFDWNWPSGSGEEDFFNINTCKHGFPIVAPSDPGGQWLEQIWIYIISESYHVNTSSTGSMVLKKKTFKWIHPFLHFCNYLPFEEDLPLNLNNLEFPIPKFDWNWLAGSGDYLKEISVYFYSFAIIFPWKRESSFIWTILNPLYLRMIYANFGYNGSGEEVKNVKV
jgi:hypothetical protein